MKRVFLVFCLFISFILTGCFIINNPEQNPESGETPSEQTTNVKIFNNSHFDIDLYSEPEREIGFYLGTVKKNESITIPAKENVAGSVYYVIFHIDIGIDLPWYNNDSYILASPVNNKTVEVKVSDPSKMNTVDAFIVLENNTNDSVIFKRGASVELLPESNKKSSFVAPSEIAIYKISSANFLNLDSFSIKEDKKGEIPLESVIPSLTKEDEGKIFTITLNENGASLKSITPFDINIRKKIWSFDNNDFSKDYSIVMRPSYDKKSTLIMGTSMGDKTRVGIAHIDEYGNYTISFNDFAAFTDNKNLDYTEIVDFIEQDDGSIVMLINQVFEYSENYLILNYNFQAKKIGWSKVIKSATKVTDATDNSEYMLYFRNDTKNKLVQIEKDKFAFIGVYNHYLYNADNPVYDRYHYMICYVDGTKPQENNNRTIRTDAFNQIISSDYSDNANGIQRNLTSAYFDGSDLYICGYNNWDYTDYSTIHTGIIWKAAISEVETGNFNFADKDVIYSHDNCLFFSIEGSGANYVACGEYKDAGNLLKGCYVTSNMIKATHSCEPVLYTVTVNEKTHCWFNQLCEYGNKIVLCGTADSKKDGSDKPLPFVVAFDYNGNKLWENLTYDSYKNALNILPNTIGTYTLQLGGSSDNIHYVNADLLGNEAK